MGAHYWVDSADVGDVVGGSWNAFIRNRAIRAVDLKRAIAAPPWILPMPTIEWVKMRRYREAEVAMIPDWERYRVFSTAI